MTKLAGLRRLARRVKGTGPQRHAATASEDSTSGGAARRSGDARRRRWAPSASDAEAPGSRAHRFVREGQHGAFWNTGSARAAEEEVATEEEGAVVQGGLSGRALPSEGSLTGSFLDFYNKKLKDLKEKEGGADHIPISGNLYMYKAIADFADATELFLRPQTCFVNVGLFLIMVLQILAPLAMLVNALLSIDFGVKNGDHVNYVGAHEFADYHFGSNDLGISHFIQRMLGLIFLILFLMNGLYVLENDRLETRKVTEMAFVFKAVRHKIALPNGKEGSPPATKTRWLWLGAIFNCTCLLLCSFAMVFVFIIEEGPKDLVLDAFGLAFIYNLDDIGGDLAFLDEKWDEDFLGDVYGEMVEDDKTKDLLQAMVQKREQEFTPDSVYWLCRIIVQLLHVVLPIVYIFLEMKPKDD